LMGGVRVSEETHRSLMEYTKDLETMDNDPNGEGDQREADVLNLLQMIVSTVDYQFA